MGNNPSTGAGALGDRFLAGCPPIPPAPSDADVQQQFEELLRSKLVTTVVLEEISALESTETKWMYISLNKFATTTDTPEREWLEPKLCVQEMLDMQLQQDTLHGLFRAVRINLILRSKDWVDKFIAADGMAALVVLLDPTKKLAPVVHMEVLNVLYALANSNRGILEMVQSPDCCARLLSTYMSTPATAIRARILKLLGIICCHSQAAQGAVMAAIGSAGDGSRRERLSALGTMFVEGESDMAIRIAILTFVNILVNTTPHAPDRIAIRDDLETVGFKTVLETLRVQDPSEASSLHAPLLVQIQVFLKGHSNDQTKTTAGLERRQSMRLEIPEPASSVVDSPAATTEPVATSSNEGAQVTAPDVGASAQVTLSLELPQREDGSDGASSTSTRSMSARKSLKLELTDICTAITSEVETEEAPVPVAQAPVQRRPSGSLLPPLSIPSIEVEIVGPRSQRLSSSTRKGSDTIVAVPTTTTTTKTCATPAPTTALADILAKLQHNTQSLDEATTKKFLSLLEKVATSLAPDSGAGGASIVDKLERSLSDTPTDDAVLRPSIRGLTPTIGGSRPSVLDLGDAAHALGGSAATPVKPHFAQRSPTHSHYEEEHSPRRSMTETESCDESQHDFEPLAARKPSGAKLALAGFFQHLKKGPGLPTTPAPTPMATASVKKDAKRPVFPSLASAAPSPMPHNGHTMSFALPPLTPLKPSLSLPPLTPMRPHIVPTSMSSVPPSPTTTRPSGLLSPRTVGDHEEHLESVKEEDTEPRSPQVKVESNADISKFRKLLAMGAPRAAVRAKMQQAGVDPDLLDRPEAESKASVAVSAAKSDATPTTDAPTASTIGEAPDISKFRKLLSMGAPLAAVKAKMCQEGLDPGLLDQKTSFPEIPAPVAPASTDVPAAAASPVVAGAITEDPVAKFRKLLTMGAPREAVKAKMRQAGVDPELLDAPPTPAPAPAPPTSIVSAPAAEQPKTIREDPEYAKFFKLLSMGAPSAAVKAKMTQAGLNPALLDTPDAVMTPLPSSSASPSTENQVPPSKTLVKDDPEYAKFFKLRSMGAPAEAVKAKMRQAGLNADYLDTPDAELPSTSPPAPAPAKVLVKDDPEYAKFFKLRTMGAPAEAVKAKMRQAGLNPDFLDTPDAELPSKAPVPPVPGVEGAAGVAPPPAPAKLNAAAALSGMFAKRQAGPEAEPATAAAPPAAAAVLVKDDPAYAKFFKLVAMGAPPDTVKGKMQMAGLRPELLDTPDAPLLPATSTSGASTGNQSTNDASAAGGVSKIPAPTIGGPLRRGNLSLAIKPAAPKPTTRPFYWQQLKGESLQGTIWEELEREQTKENNQLPLFLNDTELSTLETEFPAQAAPMTGPGTAGKRSMSMDQLPKDAMSPRVVFLIDRSRANNISIIIKQFRMSHAALREAIMKVDAQVLTIERVQGLLKILPTDEEVAAIMGYQGDPGMLNEAERVLKELISVPRLKQRLTALQSKLQFPTLVRDLQHKVDKLRSASTEVAQSAEFKTILLVVLQVGNKMNQGTTRGGAKGFRLGDLPKLAQLKSADKTTTLLHYVTRMIRQKKGNLVRLSDSLTSLYDVQNIPIPELPGDMNKVQEIVDYISNELGAQKLKNAIEEHESCDHFVPVMSEFVQSASQTAAVLKADLDKLFELLRSTMTRFGFQGEGGGDADPAECAQATSGAQNLTATLGSAVEFFNTIYEFSVAMMKADRENEVKRLREEARLKQSQKAKSAALGPRSMSSRDMLSGMRKGILPEKKKDGDEAAGPETPEPTKAKDKNGASVSPMLRQRSASLSSIVENNGGLETILASAPAKSTDTTTPGKTATTTPEKRETDQTTSKLKAPTVTPPKTSEAPDSAKKSIIKPPTNFSKDREKDAKAKPVLPVPGKIVRTTSSSTTKPTDSSNGMTKARETEEVTPFDTASIEEIRAQLASKHSINGPATSSALSPESKSKHLARGNNSGPPSPEKAVHASPEDRTLEARPVETVVPTN